MNKSKFIAADFVDVTGFIFMTVYYEEVDVL